MREHFFARSRARVGGVILLTPEPRRTIQGSIQRRTAGAGVWIGGGEPAGVYPPPGQERRQPDGQPGVAAGPGGRGAGGSDARRPLRDFGAWYLV